jgi:hypothetical protein
MRFDASDLVALEHFPLAWRWTKETHAKFHAVDLATIRPLRAESAEIAWRRIKGSPLGITGLLDGLSSDAAEYVPAVRAWLENHTRTDSDLLLIWDASTAALVNARLFARRWNDFWYPSSDDLDVVAIDESWVIRIYHDGHLERLTRQ